MKKMLRKILAVLVVFSVVLSVGIIAMQGGSLADNGIYYQNDFSGALDTENWSNASAMTVSDGTLKIIDKKTYLKLASTKNLTDYVVEAKVSMDDSNRTVKSPTAGIVMYTDSSNKGYELTLLRAYSETTGGKFNGSYVRLFDRIAGASVSKNADMMYGQIDNNVQYTLKMVIIGTKIDCYVGGVLVKSYENAYTGGGVGLNANGCVATIDDLIVRKPTVAEGGAEDVSSNESSSAPNTEEIYFSEDFNDSDAFATSGWTVTATDTPLDVNRWVDGAQGKEYIICGNGISPNNYHLTGNTVLNGTTPILDYTVEADVRVDTNSDNGDIALTLAGITARSVRGTGIEWSLMYNENGSRYVRLYNRAASGTKMLADQLLHNQLEGNQIYRLKMVVIGNTVKGYVNGVLLAEAEIESNRLDQGMPGMKGQGYTSYIDNFVVRAPSQAEREDTLSGNTSSSDSPSSSETSSTTTSSETSSTTTSSGSTSSGSGSNAYFEDDFDSGVLTGWEKTGTVTNGKYVVENTVNWAKAAALSTYSDYTVEAEVTLDPASGVGTVNEVVAGITGRVKERGTKAYELTMGYGRNKAISSYGIAAEELFLRLYSRGSGTYLGYVSVADVLGVSSVAKDSTHTIKMAFIGSTIKCFVDNKLAMVVTDTEHTAGTVGVRASSITASMDNYVMRPSTQAEIDAQLPTSSDTSSGSTSSGSTSSGSTSSGGAVVTPEGYYFYEPFENDSQFKTSGWVNGPTASKLVAGNGGLVYAKPTSPTTGILRDNATLKALTDYAVEADVMVDTTAPSAEQPVAGLIGRYSGSNGVELCLYFNTKTGANYVRLHDRKGGTVYADQMLSGELQGDTFYKLKMVFIGDTVCCYVDGEFLLAKTIATTTAGTVGIRSTGYNAYFDNLVVRPVTEDEKDVLAPPKMPQADKNGVYYSTDFEDISVLQDANWSNPMINLENGLAIISSQLDITSNTIGNLDFTLLTDYVVEATLIVDPEAKPSITRPIISITGRLDSTGSGYELGLMGTQNGSTHWLRLYNRITGTSLAEVPVTAERGKAYTLRLVMIGNTIRGYMDDTKVIELKDDTLSAGTAGFKSSGIGGFMSNFIIRKPTTAEIKGEGGSVTGGNGNNPGTGDRTLYTVFGVIAVLVMCAVLLLLLNYRKNKE